MPFDIGFIELCVLLVVGLLILGPDKLPVAARQLSKWFGGLRRTVNSFQSEMSRELEMDELRRQLEAQKQQIDNTINSMTDRSLTAHAKIDSAASKNIENSVVNSTANNEANNEANSGANIPADNPANNEINAKTNTGATSSGQDTKHKQTSFGGSYTTDKKILIEPSQSLDLTK